MTPKNARYINFCLLICLFVQTAVGTFVELCGPKYNEDITKRVYLKIYNSKFKNGTFVQTTADKPRGIARYIDASKPTVIHIHGFVESSTFANTQRIMNAYLRRGDVNVMAADWSSIAQDLNYANVCFQLPAVGGAIARALDRLSDLIDPRRLHLVGYSLGAHVAGYVGKFAQATIGRITGLDPALPLFYPGPCHVRSTDAEVVAIIHTGSEIFGTYESTGTIDFYANPDTDTQPGCSAYILPAICSHNRALQFFVESINDPTAFPAYNCKGNTISSADKTIVYFGDRTPKNKRGNYCFETKARSPYSLGRG